jgi:hypothetical protein
MDRVGVDAEQGTVFVDPITLPFQRGDTLPPIAAAKNAHEIEVNSIGSLDVSAVK